MREFVGADCECDLVDYSPQYSSGVRKRGDTLADLPACERYNWITCSHVIEHFAGPLHGVQSLSNHLTDNGGGVYQGADGDLGSTAFAGGTGGSLELFTPASLGYLQLRAGLAVSRVRLGAYLHPSGRQLLAVRAIAQLGRPSADLAPSGDTATRRFLDPGLRERLWRYALTPGNLVGALRYKGRRLFRWA